MPVPFTLQTYQKALDSKYKGKLAARGYLKSNVITEHICKTHNVIFLAKPCNLLHASSNKNGCQECKKKALVESAAKKKPSQKDYTNKCRKKKCIPLESYKTIKLFNFKVPAKDIAS